MRRLRHGHGLASSILVACGIASVLGFFAVSSALAPQPPPGSFDGWIGVVEPSTAVGSGVQVRLSASAITHGPRPRMAYSLTACGSGSFSGYLLVGGDARLEGVSLDGYQGVARDLPRGDLHVTDQAGAPVNTLSAVQVIEVSLKEMPRCLGTAADENYVGVGFRVEGVARGQVAAKNTSFFVASTVERWSMPSVGGLPGKDQQIGVFRITGAINGDFVRPPAFAAKVDAGPVPIGLQLSDARPPTETVERASWSRAAPIQASVNVLDSAHQSNLQRWNAFFAIGLGVFGSILASILFELTRPRPPQPVAAGDLDVTADLDRPKSLIEVSKRLKPFWPAAGAAGFVLGLWIAWVRRGGQWRYWEHGR